MEPIKHESRNLLKGFLIGSLVGAVAGAVFAPKFGRELESQFYSDSRAKADTLFERAKHIFSGRERSEGIILEDLEEPDKFIAEA